jgi:cytochrome c oxidase assembly factor CtaG
VSGRLSIPAGLAYLGAGFVASSFLGLALIFSSKPLYSFYEHAPRLWRFSPERAQNRGGVLVNAQQTVVVLLTVGWYVWRLLEGARQRSGRIAGGSLKPA